MDRQASDAEFTSFVEAEREWLGRLAVMLVRDRGAAEDLVQDTLLKVYGAWGRVDRATAFAYARRTMVNLATDRWRRRRYDVVSGHEADRDPSPGSAAGYEAVDARYQIVRQLGQLSARERAMVVLRYYADLPEAEVAAELGVSVGTVKSTCSRALAQLRGPEPATAGRSR